MCMMQFTGQKPNSRRKILTKEEALKIIKLLSALESWAFSTKNPLPSFVDDELIKAMAVLERVVLGKKT